MSAATALDSRFTQPNTDLEPWRLRRHLTVIEAAALIAGIDPNDLTVRNWREREARPSAFHATLTALQESIAAERLPCSTRYRLRQVGEPCDGEIFAQKAFVALGDKLILSSEEFIICQIPDWELTTIPVSVLRYWLHRRRFWPSFFFPLGESPTEFEDFRGLLPNDEEYGAFPEEELRYSPKLIAAGFAYRTVKEKGNKTSKQAITACLRQHAKMLGLVKKDGSLNNQAINEVAKVVNWEPKGGAPRTRG